MRLWTLHPGYLDARGLVAAWREALLAQKVLSGGTRGYTRHPQLARFRAARDPLAAMAAFQAGLAAEAARRGYRFDTAKIARRRFTGRMTETRGQLLYEWKHLRAKLRVRSPEVYRRLRGVKRPKAHPMFRIVPGGVREWEKRAASPVRLQDGKK
ncbi:MAG: DNA lyase [Verrucomicrobia bacterium]|nr:DNA lyase [Verrucomicrobiota bacterium]